jgi:hypothetical protein
MNLRMTCFSSLIDYINIETLKELYSFQVILIFLIL